MPSLFKKSKSDTKKFSKIHEEPIWYQNGFKDPKYENKITYALTLSICGNERIGRKLWKNHPFNVQEVLLESKMDTLSKEFGFKTRRYVFEIGPKEGNKHIHALIDFDKETEIDEDFKAHINSGYYIPNYSTVMLVPVYDEAGWIKYISKDIDK